MTDVRLRRRVAKLEQQVAELTERLDAQRGPCEIKIEPKAISLDEIMNLIKSKGGQRNG